MTPVARAALLVGLGLFLPEPGLGALRHGVVWYTPALDDGTRTLAAERYQVGVTGRVGSGDVEKKQIKSQNPNFQWFVYNSATDNYVPPNLVDLLEYEALNILAVQRALDPEIAYLHYRDDTEVVIEDDTLFVSGWGAGGALTPAEARVPVYNKSLTRRLVNFSTPQSAQLHREVMIGLAFDDPFQGTDLYPDGIFLDNCASRLFNYGIVLSGGHVLEAPGFPVIGSPEFTEWWWNENVGPFLTSLKDTLETSPAWSKDGQRKYLMTNVSNIWDDSYVSRDAADILFLEFQYNPVRVFGLTSVDEAYRRDSLAAQAGITSFYSATMTRTVIGHEGSFSLDEIMLGNLAWWLITRTSSTIFYQQGTNAPNTANWDALTWIGAMDVADQELGEALAPPYTLVEGTDPLGEPYVVKAREYEGGFVVLRNRGSFDEGVGVETAVQVSLPRFLIPLSTGGDASDPVESVWLRNGQGALFLEIPTPVTLLSFTAIREQGGASLTWESAGERADHAGFHVHREDAMGERRQLSATLIPGESKNTYFDAGAPSGETHYWLAEISRTGNTTWHGPAVLPAAAFPPAAFLAQNAPNPCRAGGGGATTIRFGVPAQGRVAFSVIDLAGREVVRLVDETLPPGGHEITWTGQDARGNPVRPGLYFYRLVTPLATLSRKLLLIP